MVKDPHQIIEQYGGCVEERIAACGDKQVAEYLKQQICTEIKRHFNDNSLLKQAEAIIDQLIDARFNVNKKSGSKMKRIDKNIPIEELITKHPFSVHYLMKQGIKCIVCGEPIWGTLEDVAKEKGLSDEAVDRMVIELNDIIDGIE